MIISTTDIWLCQDCGMVSANGTDGWGLDDDGNELGEIHAARMVAHDAHSFLVVSGCADDCQYADDNAEHECRFDREFSSVECAGCGTTLAGYRFAGVEFAR